MTRSAALCLAVALLNSTAPAAAQSIQESEADSQESPPPGVFGPFDRLRRDAADAGVTLSARYTSELAYNPSGGDESRVAGTGQVDVRAKVDLGRLVRLRGGTFNAVVTWRRGELLDDVAGINALQQTQEVYGRGQTWRLTRFWYEQALGRASVKLGRSKVGEDFASFSCDSLNLTFCGAQPGNVVGDYWFNWPISQWMARGKVSFGSGSVQLGAYEVNRLNLRKTFSIGYLHGATGVLIPLESVWKPKVGGLPGTYRIGGWYDTSHADDVVLDNRGGLTAISGLAPLQRDGRWGGWAVLRQRVTGQADQGGTVRGLTVFLRPTEADRRTARVDSQLVAGLFYEGLRLVAPDDVLGLAVGRTHVNNRIASVERLTARPVDGSETEGELFYSLHPIAGLILCPNVQYVVDPGGRRNGKDVVVLG